jgi:hypothetical protein
MTHTQSQSESRKGLRTETLHLIMQYNMSVREFQANAARTRLRSTKDITRVEKHIRLWTKYGWL